MDEIDFFSSSDDGQQHMKSVNSSELSRETPSTDNQNALHKKNKNSKKIYQPIRDGNIIIRYQDDPVQYKKLRKKIQNRESAARVRGRKKGTINSLQGENQQLKKYNSELLVKNTALETQNKALKNQVQFLRSLVKTNTPQNIDKYLNIDPQKQQKIQEQYQSPFNQDEDSFNWIRLPSFDSRTPSNWSTIFILSVVVCVFVLPSSESASGSIANQISAQKVTSDQVGIQILMGWIKELFRYIVGIGYSYLLGKFIYEKFIIKKRKNV